MKESVFANEFKLSCNNYKTENFYYKIPDAFGMDRFSPPKPYDAFLLINGQFNAIEFKMHKTKTAFPFNKVREHQVDALLQVYNSGGEGYIIINCRMKGYNKTHIIQINKFIDMMENADRKSIPFTTLLKFKEITRHKNTTINKYVWDISYFDDEYDDMYKETQ